MIIGFDFINFKNLNICLNLKKVSSLKEKKDNRVSIIKGNILIQNEIYELLDEHLNEINEVAFPTIESFFQPRFNEFHQALVIFRARENYNKQNPPLQNNAIEMQLSQENLTNPVQIKIKSNEDYMYNQFYRRFPGLKVFSNLKLIHDLFFRNSYKYHC